MLGEGNHFIPNINEGIRIHHVGNHWVTSSSVGSSLAVYDIMFSGKLSTSLQCQLATIYKLMILREEDGEVVDPHIQVHVPNLPQQQGVADCGVMQLHMLSMQQEGTVWKILSLNNTKCGST